MVRLDELTYSEEQLTQDAIHYFETAVYEPSYAKKVKDFLAEDAVLFKNYFDDEEYAFCNIYADEFQKGYVDDGMTVAPQADFDRLKMYMSRVFSRFDVDEDEIEKYIYAIEAEFRKNAFCSHMEPYFVGTDAVVATIVGGYARNPLFSIYSLVREWCMALHMKKMYPDLMRKFGYRYQLIRTQFSGEERLKRLIDYRDKYRLTFQNIGAFRALHSSVFAYVYIYLKAIQTREVLTAEQFIMDNSSSQIFLLLQGETIENIDFPVTKYALDKLKEGAYADLMTKDGVIDWDALYDFVLEAMRHVGNLEGLRSFGFDGIDAKTIQSFWNKSANMQGMLKILRRLAMDNSDPVINQLIQMCEYRLGRPDKAKDKMERFIEETRKIMVARVYEMMQPRTMAQELLARFPSVFLVYFQWHHNFRNIYPKFPEAANNKIYNMQQQQKLQAESTLKNRIFVDDQQKMKTKETEREQQKKTQDEDKLRLIIQNKEKTMAELSKTENEKKKTETNNLVIERNQRQNSL